MRDASKMFLLTKVLCLGLLLAVLCGTLISPVILWSPGPMVKVVFRSVSPAAFSIEYLMLTVQGTVKKYSCFSF